MAEKVVMKKDNFRYDPINASDNPQNGRMPNYAYLTVVRVLHVRTSYPMTHFRRAMKITRKFV